MKHTNKSLHYLLVILSVLQLLAITFVIVSALIPAWFEGEDQSSWFQRSGAVLVVITVWVQFKLQSVYTYFDQDAYVIPIHLSTFIEKCYSVIAYLNVFFAIVGTLIWGYGDLFLSRMLQITQ